MLRKNSSKSIGRRYFRSLLLRQLATTFSVIALSLQSVVPVSASILPKIGTRQMAKDQICPGGTLSVTLPVPPEGMASTRTVTFDENCKPIFGPIQFVPANQLSYPSFSQSDVRGDFTTLTGQTKQASSATATATSSWTLHAEQAIWDCCGIRLNYLYTNDSWTANGTNILSYNVGGGYLGHSESTCGNGWYSINPYLTKTGGGVGQTTASFHGHVEWGYKGFFDCTGAVYYNIQDNYTTIGGNGGATCNFTKWSRTWLGSWSWVTACTR